jgi:catechol 2,3-dioxygenase-like lactoylglutathione lyase family enzyme
VSVSVPNQPLTLGVHHVGLSVSSLANARSFFQDALGFRQTGERPDYPAAMMSDGTTMITLWQVTDPTQSAPFDRHRNVGLHHLALRVANVAALDDVHARIVAAGAQIEFAPEMRADGKAKHLMCTIPGGPRVEFLTLLPESENAPA